MCAGQPPPDENGVLRELMKQAPALKHTGAGMASFGIAWLDTPGHALMFLGAYLGFNVGLNFLQRTMNPIFDALGKRGKQFIERPRDRSGGTNRIKPLPPQAGTEDRSCPLPPPVTSEPQS
jgi:hypothetical protein